MSKILRIALVIMIVASYFVGLLVNPKNAEATASLVINSSFSDGHIYATGGNYLNVRAAVTGTLLNDSTAYITLGQSYDGVDYTVFRSYLYFDTSSISSSATIISATLSLYGWQDASTQDFDIDVISGQPTYPHDPLIITDYDRADYVTGSVGGSLNTAGFSTSAYNNINLNATGLAFINKGGWTKLTLMSSRDIASNAPVAVAPEWIKILSSNFGLNVPKLTVVYNSLPIITADAATLVTATTVMINSTVVDDGGVAGAVSVRWGYGTTSHVATDFLNYTSISGWMIGYSTGSTPFTNLTSLLPNTTYYYRVQAKNGLGIEVTCTTEQSFTTLVGTPAINSTVATLVAVVSAQLNALVVSSGGENCQTSWGYGTTSHTAVDFALYDVVTAFAGSYATNATPYYSATSLSSNTVYYYRVQIKNSAGTITSASEQTFTTADILGDVTNFKGTSSTTSIDLTWTQASASSETQIYYKTTPYASTDPNVILNASFETNDPPANWTLAGAGATVARSNVQAKYGTYSALLTRNGANCEIFQNYAGYASLAGQTITFGCWVYTNDGNNNTAFIYLYDGHLPVSVSSFHTATVGWQWITVTKTINAAPTVLKIACAMADHDVGVYFDWATLWLPEGTRIYNGSSNSYTHTGLNLGTTYYYAAFGSSGTLYSTEMTLLTLTTLGISATGVPSGGTLPVPTLPSAFNQSVDSTKLNKFEPFYSIISGFATSWGMPTNTMWVVIILAIIAVIGLVVLIESQSVFAALLTIATLMLGCIFMTLLPAWMVVIVLLAAIGAWATRQDFG